MSSKKTLIIGASENPSRYSYLALHKLLAHGHEVVAIGKEEGMLNNIPIQKGTPEVADVHTITLYLNPANQKNYYDYIISLHPTRLIFNPGTENDELERMANEKGIQTLHACTLVMLSTNQY